MSDAEVSTGTTELASEPSAALIGGTLGSIYRSLSRRIERAVEEFEMSADHWYTLDVIVQNDGIAMNDLARSLSIPPPTVTKFVDRLVVKALAFRLVDQDDRRRVLVHASRRGGQVHASLVKAVEQEERRFVEELPNRTQRSALRMLGAGGGV